jgi:hypothetical protein
MSFLFVGQAAIEVGNRLGRTVTPREITALFYHRILADDIGPIVGGRRLLRPEALDEIAAVLKSRKREEKPTEVVTDEG